MFIYFSGGIPHVMLNLARHCARISSRKLRPWWWWLLFNKRKISQDILKEVLDRRKIFYNNTLTEEQKKILRYVKNHKNYLDKNDKEFLTLVNQNLINQYGPEDNIWHDVNPIIKEFLLESQEPDEDVEE